MNKPSPQLRDTYPATFSAVRSYLFGELDAQELHDEENFQKDGIDFHVMLPSSRRVTVFVSHELLDCESGTVTNRMHVWSVASKAANLSARERLVVTPTGCVVEAILEDRKLMGPTLREATGLSGAVLSAQDALDALQQRVFSIPVDGVPLGDIPAKFAGVPEYYSRFSDDFAELVGSAYLLDAAQYRGISLERKSGIPDLKVRFPDQRPVYFEFARVVFASEKFGADLREYVNGMLRRLAYTDPKLRKASDGLFVSINLPDIAAGKKQRQQLIGEISEFVTSGDARNGPKGEIDSFSGEKYPNLEWLNASVYVADGPTSLSVQEAAKSFDPYAPFRRIAELVRAKAKLRYTASPVWLGISLAEYVALLPPATSMDPRRIPEITIESTPFEKILVGSAGSLIEIFSKVSAGSNP